MNQLQQMDGNRSQPMDAQLKACRRDGRKVRSLRMYLSRLFQATLTLVTTLPKGELSADPDEYVPLCMGLTDLWGAESGDPGPRLLD